MKNLLLKKVEKNCVLLITLLIGSFGYAQITQRGTATTATTTTSSLTINKPAGVVAGDVMIVNILHNDTSNNVTLTNASRSGWALIHGNLIHDGGNNSWRGTILYRVADGTEGASFAFTLDATTDMGIGSIIAFYNVDTTGGFNENGAVGGPFDVDPGTINVTNSATSTAGAITTANNNAAVIMLTQIADNRNQSNWITTSPGTLTELYDNITNSGDDGGVGAAWRIKATAGVTGVGNSTITASVRNGAILIALKLCIPNTIALSSAVGTNTQTICVNTDITDITYNTSGATGATFSGLPAGVTGNWGANVVTISGTPSVSGTFPYTVTLTGGCGTIATETGTLTVVELPTSVSGTDVITCATTGAVNITAGSSATNYSSVTWTSSGSGIFTDANSLTTCTYTPSVADIAAGSVTLALTAVGNSPCGNVTSTKTLTITNPMTAIAGTDLTTCSSTGAIDITTGSSATNQTLVAWTSSGTGTFTDENSLTTCTYEPSVDDITAGSVTLILTASNGSCADVTSTKTLTIVAAATSVAGSDINTCATAGAATITTGSSATNYTSVTWTSSGTGTFVDANSLTTCTYEPSADDIIAGSVTLTLTASGNSPCSDATSTKTLTISNPMTVDAGTDITTCSTTGAIDITTGSSATNQTLITWTSSGTGTFNDENSLTTCTYTPSSDDIAAGSVTLTLTASNDACADETSTKTLTITVVATSVAGTDVTTCASNGAVNITAGSSATNQTLITWTSSGTGTFTDVNSLTTCTYEPSADDIAAGSVILTLTAASNAPCGDIISTKTVTISSPMTVDAGTAITTCATDGAVNITAGSSATNQTLVAWTSSGTGAFANANSLTTCTYTPSAADITAGSVTLTLTASNVACADVTSTKTLTINAVATSVAGTAITTCATSGAVTITAGSSATNYSSVTWTSNGTGTFTNANSLTTCTYTPSAADIIAGSRTLTLTANGNSPCGNVTSTKTLTINGTMTAVAGTAVTTCSTAGAVNITAGSSATNQTLVTWTSSGTGTFANANSLTTCTYTPSGADITAGSVTLTLTASNTACANVTSTKTLTITAAATSVAGTNITTCATSGAVTITAGSSATNYSSVTWTSNGTGTFTNANSLTTCTYTPSAADIIAGSRTLTLTANGNSPCGNVTSTKTITIYSTPTAVAGPIVNMCGVGGAYNITAGASATNYSLVTWTSSGTGSFTNPNSLTTCTYTPSAADTTAGSVTLTLTVTGNAPCGNATSTKTLNITGPTATAGTSLSTCSTSGAINITAGASATNYTSVTWTSNGTGTFTNANSLTLCTYTPSAADIAAGSRTLTLTASNGVCSNDTSIKTLTIYVTPTITGTTPATRTGAGSLILGATASVGTVYWYSALTGGTSLGFGTSFSTPSISVTTTYYVAAVNGTCTSTPRIPVVATVIYPEMDVQGNATSIVDGDTTPASADWTDFGTTNLTRTFTIRNTGAGVLSLGAITISGANASEFTVTTPPSNPISSGSSTTFIVTFNPTAAGTRTANLSIANNDTDENPYDFTVQGTGVAQEINILGNATSIIDGDTTPTTTDWTDFSTLASTRTFTIQNTGNVILTIGTITIDGIDAADFSVTTPPSATVAAYSSTTFVVTFIPSVINTRSAAIHIVNNDTDENTYDFAIQGFGIIPEIDIQGNGISIVDGDITPSTTDWTDFSTTNVTRTFTIFNAGNTALTIGAITFTGTDAADFSVTTPPSTSVTAFGSTTFTVTFSPSSAAVKNATINIVNNDTTGGENPYSFDLRGTGVAREINIQGNATSITDGDTTPTIADWTDFSSVTYTRTFTIQNTGNMPLTIGAITFVGGNNTDFTVTTPPSGTVGAFGSTTFVVTFTPGAGGTRFTTMNIANNDSNENPYDFRIQGFGGTPEINIISQYNVSILDGDTTPSTTDQTDFGTVSIENGYVIANLIIQNTGTGALTIGAATFTGANASDFSMVTTPSATIAAGGTSRFQIRFKPTVKGTKTATFSIVNNDSNENPYNFDLTGLGVQTYADTDGDGITDNKDLDDDNDGIIDIKEHTDGLAYPLTGLVQYTFLNETFGTGTTKGLININTPGATSTYCYEDGYGSPCDASPTLEDGEYCVNYKITGTIASDPENIHGDLAWYNGLDHTPSDTNGRMAVFNASYAAGTFYEIQIDGVIPNVPISYNFWVLNIMKQSNFPGSILPNITVEFLDLSNNLISSFTTGDVGRCSSTPTDNTCALSNWLQFSTSVNLGNISSFIVRFKNNSTGGGGNDLAIDDIVITQNYIDTDGDGIANIFDLDDENDGIPDVEEAGFKEYSNGLSKIDITAGTWADANSNGLLDAIDAQITAGTYSIPDTDGDLVPNYLDLDSDNDSFFDVDEAGILNGDGDINGDGRGDLVDTDRDGILDLYDNNVGFGTTVRAYATDTDSNGVADYLQLDSNNDGTKDIETGLYNSLDTNNDGVIDGSTDVDKDGILDSFDTNTLVIGSPRDLDRKLFLDFDGRNDYAENVAILGGLANATLMAWVDLNSTFSTNGVVVGQDKFQLRINSAKNLEAIINGTTVTFNTALTTSQWYHVAATYGGGNLNLYLNGKLVATQPISGNIAADATKLTLGRNPAGTNNYFKGKIDEVRVFNAALTAAQVQRMVYQEIQNSASQVRGSIVPKDVGSLPFSNVLRYYRMDAYKDDIVDDLTTASIDSGTGMKMYNHKLINVQQAPMPFVTVRTGTLATAVNDATKDIRGLDILDLDYSIVQVKHNITETGNSTDLAMFVDPGVTVSMTNNTKLQNDWYLKLDGKIDLVGKSQFVQTTNSELDVTSAGSLERDQQGQAIRHNYNYWSSPVSSINNSTINHGFTVAGVMKDGTDINNIQNLQWTTGVNGSPTTPITLSSYWIFKFQNSSNSYANWSSVGQNGTLLPGQGYTLKGCGSAAADQNYTFVGKPNNGTITSTVGPNNLNLCGNPYPSAIDANQFIDDNVTSIQGTLYIWEHYNTNSTHTTVQYQGGYATYTKTGGTAPVAPAGVSGLGSSSKTPKRFIPIGQGFFVTGSATGGTITFNNGQRLFVKEDDATSYTMFKQNNSLVNVTNSAFNNQRDNFVEEQFMKLRLGYNSADNYHRQTLLGYMNQNATAGFDNGYDGISIETLTNDMYFINGTNKLNINGDGYFNVNNIYPLGIKNAVAGNVSFVVDGKENFDDSQEIYIYDNVTSIYHSIKDQNFQINLPAGTYDTRFSLRFTNGTSLGTVDNAEANHGISVIHSQANNIINIKNELQEVTVKSVLLFNLLGQQVMDWKINNQNQANIELQVTNLSSGTYIVKVITDGGDVSKKIIIK